MIMNENKKITVLINYSYYFLFIIYKIAIFFNLNSSRESLYNNIEESAI